MRKQDRGLSLTLSSVLEAPRDRVFRALTDPGELATWWGPHGFTMPEAELDLRVGGGYRFSMRPPEGGLFHLSGEFLEIAPPARLAYTFRWEEPTPDDRETVVTLSLEARGGATELSLSQGPFATEERLELHRRGWTESFDRLRGVLGSGAQPHPGGVGLPAPVARHDHGDRGHRRSVIPPPATGVPGRSGDGEERSEGSEHDRPRP